MLQLQKLTLCNILGWHSLELSLANQGLTYIVGPNGSGKSSIPASILWIWTGKTSRADSIDEIVHSSYITEGAYGKLDLLIGTTAVSISRYRNHPEHKNALYVTVGTKTYKPRHAKAGVELLQSLLHTTEYDEVARQVYFASGEIAFFSQLREAEQKRLIRERFRLYKYAQAGDWIKEQTRKLTEQYTSQAYQVEHLRGRVAVRRSAYLKAKRGYQVSQQQQTQEAHDIESERVQVDRKYQKVTATFAQLQQRIRVIYSQRQEVRSLAYQLDRVNNHIQEVRQTSICPTCGQTLPKSQKKEQLHSLKDQKLLLLRKIQELESEISPLPSLEERLGKLSNRKLNLVQKLQELKSQLRLTREKKESVFAELSKTKQAYAQERQKLEAAEHALELLEQQAQYYDWWTKGFSSRGVELFAFSRVLPIFDHRINEYLKQLPTPRGIIKNKFYIEDEHLRHTFIYNKRSTTYSSLSGGERRRVDLAIALADDSFNQNHCNVWFLDEAFEGLDALGVQKALEVLKKCNRESVFVTSHSQDLEGFFEKIVKCRNVGNTCEIQQVTHLGQDVTLL